jgi:hypothetical protein
MLAAAIGIVVSAMTTVSPALMPLMISTYASPTAPVTILLTVTVLPSSTFTVADVVPVGVTADAGRTTVASTVFVVMVAWTREPSGSPSPPDGTVMTVAYVVDVVELFPAAAAAPDVAPAAAAAANETPVDVGSRLMREMVPVSEVPPTELVTVAVWLVATCARLASGTGTVTSMAPEPMMTAEAAAVVVMATSFMSTSDVAARLPGINRRHCGEAEHRMNDPLLQPVPGLPR